MHYAGGHGIEQGYLRSRWAMLSGHDERGRRGERSHRRLSAKRYLIVDKPLQDEQACGLNAEKLAPRMKLATDCILPAMYANDSHWRLDPLAMTARHF